MATALPREVLDYQNPYTMAVLQNSWIQSHFERTVEFIKLHIGCRTCKTGSILEHGCGSGRLFHLYWQTLLRRSGKFIGIDISSTMIDYARRMVGSEQGTFYSIEEAYEHSSRVDNNYFDIAISSFVCSYIIKQRLKLIFDMMYQKLTGSGRFVLVLAFSEAETVAGKNPIQLFSMNEWALPNNAKRFGVEEWANVYPNTVEECIDLVREPLNDANFDCSHPLYHSHEFFRDFNNLFELKEFLQLSVSSTIRTPSLLKPLLYLDKRFIEEQCELSYNGHDTMGPIRIGWKFFTLIVQKKIVQKKRG